MKILADVENVAQSVTGAGPIYNIVSFSCKVRMSRAGRWQMVVPAIDSRALDLLSAQRTVHVYGIVNGARQYLGGGSIDEIKYRVIRDIGPSLIVSGTDLLGELAHVTVGELTLNSSGDTNLSTLSGRLPVNWNVSYSGGSASNFYAKLVHESTLGAYISLADKLDAFFRRETDGSDIRHVRWRNTPYSTATVVAIMNADPFAAEDNANICLIERIEEVRDSNDILNVAFVYGSGDGENRFRLHSFTDWPDGTSMVDTTLSANANGGDGTITVADITGFADTDPIGILLDDETWHVTTINGTPAGSTITLTDSFPGSDTPTATSGNAVSVVYTDGDSNEFAFERATHAIHNITSIDIYGVRQQSLVYKDVAPIANTDAAAVAGADFLALTTCVHLAKHGDELRTYRCTVTKLDVELLPGDLVRVQARRFVDGERPINIDQTLTVLEVETEVDQNGRRTAAFTAATLRRWPESGVDVIAKEVRKTTAIEAHPQLGPSQDTLTYHEAIDSGSQVVLYFPLDEAITAVNSVVLRVRIDPLRATVRSVGTTTDTTGDESTHTHDVPDHDHTILIAGNQTTGLTYNVGFGAGGVAGGLWHDASDSDTDYPTDGDSGAVTSEAGDAHSHSVTPNITTVYGIFDDALASTFTIEELQYAPVGTGTYTDFDSGDSIGSDWYEVELSSSLIDTETLRPSQKINFINIRAQQDLGTDITNITQADPGVVTAAGHGFSDGDRVYIKNVTGMTEVNTGTFVVANKTTNTFELDGVDTSGYTAYSSDGHVSEYKKGRITAQIMQRCTIQSVVTF